ncbi:MAG TPA: STAS domain-containing protein [Candidatus Tumulicola sp.]
MEHSTPFVVSLKRAEYDISSRDELGLELEDTYTHSNVILDVSAVNYIDSTCLSRLVAMRKRREESGFRPVRLVLTSIHVRHLFKILTFDEIWPIYETLQAALEDALAEGKKDKPTTK